MPTVTVARADVTLDETIAALQAELGSRWDIKAHGTKGDAIDADKSAVAGARIHVRQENGATQFHVHGTGIIIGRIVNELTTARQVAGALNRRASELSAAPAS